MTEDPDLAPGVPAQGSEVAPEGFKARRRRLQKANVAKRQEERRQIVALVLAGVTYTEIARQLGKTPSTIQRRFNDEIARNAKATEEGRAFHVARLERRILRWWDTATRSETHDARGNELSADERKERAQRADKAEEHLRYLLDQYAKVTGLYHPTEVKLTGDLTVEVSVPELNRKFEDLKREYAIAQEAKAPPTRALPAASHDG